ncbi:DNA-binding transcriptional regulator YdaS (Cro superfamily) [Variovorax sp. GrIS 2.14]|uniref:YdaS family helix-turn-helix protein n=1 Tax=Variovorax sp. GrIS 2.14 TaxID=3071709 RepID=UPI0038F70B37
MNYKSLPQFVADGGVGTSGRLAVAIGAAKSDMSDWVNGHRAVPMLRALAIDDASLGIIPRWLTRPDDWHVLWPELVKHKDAPAIVPAVA